MESKSYSIIVQCHTQPVLHNMVSCKCYHAHPPHPPTHTQRQGLILKGNQIEEATQALIDGSGIKKEDAQQFFACFFFFCPAVFETWLCAAILWLAVSVSKAGMCGKSRKFLVSQLFSGKKQTNMAVPFGA